MRITVHDYSGHAFPVTLSRELAKRGLDVQHVYCSSFLSPKGSLAKAADDPASFNPVPIKLAESVDKGSLFKRRRQEIEHGLKLIREIEQFRPDVVLSGNAPLDVQRIVHEWCRKNGTRFVFWVQDITGEAVGRLLKKRLGPVSSIVGRHYSKLEAKLLNSSDAVVVISEDFTQVLQRMGVQKDRITVIENWAALDEMPLIPRPNAWTHEQGLENSFVYLYSGTLGMKHNPELLLQLAKDVSAGADPAQVVVISEGAGANWLKNQATEQSVKDLRVLPFQPFARMPEVVASADVLTAILEPDAGIFSVPSKVLTYLCAGKPLLLAVPPENLASRIVTRAGAGLVCPPTDISTYIANAKKLQNEASTRQAMGASARAYAEKTFDVRSITDRFLPVLFPGKDPGVLQHTA